MIIINESENTKERQLLIIIAVFLSLDDIKININYCEANINDEKIF